MKNAIKKFWDSEDGMGVVEVVLIEAVTFTMVALKLWLTLLVKPD